MIVCSDHFLASDYQHSLTGLKKLKKTAVPSVFDRLKCENAQEPSGDLSTNGWDRMVTDVEFEMEIDTHTADTQDR